MKDSLLITVDNSPTQKILSLESIVKLAKYKSFMNILSSSKEQFKTPSQLMKTILNQTILLYGHFIQRDIDKSLCFIPIKLFFNFLRISLESKYYKTLQAFISYGLKK